MAQLGGASVYLAGQDIGLGQAGVDRRRGPEPRAVGRRRRRPDVRPGDGRRARAPRRDPGRQRALGPRAPVPGARRLLHAVGAGRRSPRPDALAWIGDGNNVSHSLILLAALVGTEMSLAVPPGYEPDRRVLETARAWGGRVTVTDDVPMAARDADAIYTDVWTSMGQEAERERRLEAFSRYQVNDRVVGFAKPGAVVMHCLPAHRGRGDHRRGSRRAAERRPRPVREPAARAEGRPAPAPGEGLGRELPRRG